VTVLIFWPLESLEGSPYPQTILFVVCRFQNTVETLIIATDHLHSGSTLKRCTGQGVSVFRCHSTMDAGRWNLYGCDFERWLSLKMTVVHASSVQSHNFTQNIACKAEALASSKHPTFIPLQQAKMHTLYSHMPHGSPGRKDVEYYVGSICFCFPMLCS
jgi:hypothetical protein